MNLFFVHTPIQLLIAQNLVDKLQLKNNHLVLGYTGVLGKTFYESYDILLRDECWDEKYDIDNIIDGTIDLRNYFQCLIKFNNFNRRLKSIIQKNTFDNIYFGDINHYAYLYIADKCKKNRNFYFFEEGLSHYNTYTLRKKFDKTLAVKIKSFLLDLNYFFYGVRKFSDYFYSTKDVELKFNMVEKYTIMSPTLKGYKYVPFKFTSSLKLQQILDEELSKLNSIKGHVMLYLSTTSTVEFTNPEKDELKMLDIIFSKIDASDTTVLLKFHPKDEESKKDFIKHYFKQKGIYFFEVLKEYKLPIEVIYYKFKPNTIVGYDSSSLLYAQVMQAETKVISMLPYLLSYYSKNNIKNDIMNIRWSEVEGTQKQLLNKSFDNF